MRHSTSFELLELTCTVGLLTLYKALAEQMGSLHFLLDLAITNHSSRGTYFLKDCNLERTAFVFSGFRAKLYCCMEKCIDKDNQRKRG